MKPVEVKPVEVKPVEVKPVEVKPAETKPVETKPTETKPTETKPTEEAKAEETKAEETKAEETKAEETKAGKIPKSWDKFESANNEAFRARLNEFRGNDNLNPDFSGGEGRIFSAEGKLSALKRWFKSRLGDMSESLSKLEEVKADIESNPKLKADIDVVKIHEKGPDWIRRDFDPNSVELKAAGTDAQAVRARAINELESLKSKGGLSDILADVLKKLKKEPPSANLHWSPSKGKILIIDMQ